jgi:hypothetical protein
MNNCAVCHHTTAPTVLHRFAGVCQRCHNRRRVPTVARDRRCDCGALQPGPTVDVSMTWHMTDCAASPQYRPTYTFLHA